MVAKILKLICLLLFLSIGLHGEEAIDGEIDETFEWTPEQEQFRQTYDEYASAFYHACQKISLKLEEQCDEFMVRCNCASTNPFREGLLFSADLTAYRRATVNEGRKLLIYLANKFVSELNDDPSLQPFFEKYPLTLNNASLSIRFIGILGRYTDGNLSHISKSPNLDKSNPRRNQIFYETTDPFTGEGSKVHVETYEEGEALAAASPIPYPFAHDDTLVEYVMDVALESFLATMRGERLRYRTLGPKWGEKGIEEIGGRFSVIERHLSQDQARKLEVKLVRKLLEHINYFPEIRPFLAEYPFPSSRLKLCLIFGNKNSTPLCDGSMSYVILNDDEITYYSDLKIPDETEKDRDYWERGTFLIDKEPYTEALKIVENAEQHPYRTLYNRVKQKLFVENKGNKEPPHLRYPRVPERLFY